MNRTLSGRLAGLALAAGLGNTVQAAVVWNEADAGDLSGDFASPNFVALSSGTNDVLGRTGGSGGAGNTPDRDYFTITVASGQVLSAIRLLGNTSLVTGTDKAFIGIYGGTVASSPADPWPGLLGYALFANADIGQDLLPVMGNSAGVPPFSPPLGAGQYTLWVQDTTAGIADYGLQLVVSSVPEPAPAGLLAAGLLALGWLTRRRAR